MRRGPKLWRNSFKFLVDYQKVSLFGKRGWQRVDIIDERLKPPGMTKSLFELNRRFIDAALAKANEFGVKVSIAVVDAHGDLIIVERMSGAVSLSPKLAMGKASAAAIFMRPTAEFEPRIQQNPTFWAGVSSMTSGNLLFGRGAVPLKRSGETIGAIGVSGALPEQDEMIAQHAAGELDKM